MAISSTALPIKIIHLPSFPSDIWKAMFRKKTRQRKEELVRKKIKKKAEELGNLSQVETGS